MPKPLESRFHSFIILKATTMTRYLAVFQLPRPTREHAKIDDVIRSGATGGDFKKIVLGASTVLYLFDAPRRPHELSFSRILLTGDEVAFFEIGEYFTANGFRTLQGWLNSHRQK